MKKSLKTLTLLFFMPWLMANALGPSNYYSEYFHLSLEYVSSTQVEETYYHTYHLNNNGDGYVDYISIRDGDGETYHYMELNGEKMSDTFHNVVLAPGFNGDITFTSESPIINTSSSVSYAAHAYKTGTASPLKDIKGIEYAGQNAYGTYMYQIDFKKEQSHDAIFHIDYNGHDYNIVSKTGGSSNHRIYTPTEIDLEKLSIKDFFFIEPHVAFRIDDSALTRAMVIFLAGFLFLASLIVFPAVFIPAMVRRKRRRNAANK